MSPKKSPIVFSCFLKKVILVVLHGFFQPVLGHFKKVRVQLAADELPAGLDARDALQDQTNRSPWFSQFLILLRHRRT